MPIEEQDVIEGSVVVSEYRKIKIGEKGDRAPKKYKAPVVSFPVKGKAGSKFDVDEHQMSIIRQHQGLEQGKDILGVPVRLLSDNINDVMYVYRGMYNSFGRSLCKSNLGDPKAKRWITSKDPGEENGKKQGKFFILNEPREVDCSRAACPLFVKPGEPKKDCSWHSIVTVQLEHDPVFPQPTRYRTSGWMVINHLRGSLNKLASVTGGILANIPLMLVEIEIRTKTATGEDRLHPVMEFRYQGTLNQLREDAIKELESRRRLSAAISGKPISEVTEVLSNSFTGGAMSTSAHLEDGPGDAEVDEVDDFVEFDGTPPEESQGPSAEELEEEKKLNEDITATRAMSKISERGFDAIVDKHNGDMKAVLAEMIKLYGGAKTAAQVVKKDEPQKAAVKPAVKAPEPEVIGDDDFGYGDASDEPAEEIETPVKQATVVNKKPVQVATEPAKTPQRTAAPAAVKKPPPAQQPRTQQVASDEFDIFD